VLVQLGAQPRDVPLAERDRPAPRRAVGRVRDAHEPLAARRLEQLDDRREPTLPYLLPHG
jgi:hypothetical protein